MHTVSYHERRGELEHYFDRTAAETWSRLTSDAPLGRIRATVRAGRDEMRRTLLAWLPEDLSGCRLLDAGCGTGALAVEAARRGAQVVAIDLSPTLVALARQRSGDLGAGAIEFRSGDMLDPAHGRFDYVVAMDSVIHYEAPDMVRILAGFAARTERAILFTFAPSTSLLRLMHGVGRLFPRSNRSPAIEPIHEAALRRRLAAEPRLSAWAATESKRVAKGFYISHGMELRPA
jgi:magnesium-protoporphyrin O-methyltransferase